MLNLSWFLFYGRLIHMSRDEIMNTRVGEMLDMINCMAINNGAIEPVKDRRMSFDEAMMLR